MRKSQRKKKILSKSVAPSYYRRWGLAARLEYRKGKTKKK